MEYSRIITLVGDKEWIERTLKKSLPEGEHIKIFGKGRKIIVKNLNNKKELKQ